MTCNKIEREILEENAPFCLLRRWTLAASPCAVVVCNEYFPKGVVANNACTLCAILPRKPEGWRKTPWTEWGWDVVTERPSRTVREGNSASPKAHAGGSTPAVRGDWCARLPTRAALADAGACQVVLLFDNLLNLTDVASGREAEGKRGSLWSALPCGRPACKARNAKLRRERVTVDGYSGQKESGVGSQ